MIGALKKRLDAVDRATLTRFVRSILENQSAEAMNWRYQPVEGGFGNAFGVYRFQGQAQAQDETLNWSLILKATGPATGSQEPAAWNYWKREVLVYQSGLLNDLPGDLVAPRCIGVVEYPGQEFWLWLEDVVESEKVWSLERYGLAARHLGQFNGAYLVGKPIPRVPWLSTGQFRKRLAMAEPGVAELPQLSRHPLFEGLLPDDSLERSLTLWAERQRFLALLDRLPRSLCHHDAFRGNLIARNGRDGQAQTVAIDWTEMGTGGLGEEIASLFLGLRFVAIDIDRIADLDALIFAGYVDGLRDAGWQGDSWLARFGYAATAALSSIAEKAITWPRIARRVAALGAEAEPPRLLSPGGPAQAAAEQLHLLSLGEEAYALLDTLG
jgi:Phosphotransferase enzyme family